MKNASSSLDSDDDDGDDDDDDDDDEFFFFVLWLTDKRRLALFPAGTIVEILIIANLQHATRST